jgi:alkanesulfonate monooxygenase SsuD/methylene tetrahydromethanopterin reductase-like flavin-dependent oxidoreductase (luciferase family)
MKYGLFVNPQAPSSEAPESLADGMISMAKAASDIGFDHVSSGQHYLSDFTQIQLLPYLARLTGEVDIDELSTGAVVLPLQQPVDLAEQIATIDAMHDGKTHLGVAAGYRDVEFENFGIPKSQRAPRLTEAIEIISQLLTEREVTYDGKFYSVTDATLPFRPDGEIPIWIAANADVAVERSARISDGWFVNPHSTVSEIVQQKQDIYDPVREEAGEDTGVPVIRETFVAPTREEAVDVARKYLEQKYQRYVEWGQDEAMEDDTELSQPFDRLAEDRFLLGTPEEVAAEIQRYKDELNPSHMMFRLQWPGLSYDRSIECIELIGDEVIPNV